MPLSWRKEGWFRLAVSRASRWETIGQTVRSAGFFWLFYALYITYHSLSFTGVKKHQSFSFSNVLILPSWPSRDHDRNIYKFEVRGGYELQID
jgi:hypothetical protein